MLRLIKWLFFIAILGAIVLWVTGYKIHDKTIQEHLAPVLKSKVVNEGVKDLRSLVGEGLKAAGEAISEDVTDSEREEFEGLIKQEVKRGRPIEGESGQEALPPKFKSMKPSDDTNRRQTR